MDRYDNLSSPWDIVQAIIWSSQTAGFESWHSFYHVAVWGVIYLFLMNNALAKFFNPYTSE